MKLLNDVIDDLGNAFTWTKWEWEMKDTISAATLPKFDDSQNSVQEARDSLKDLIEETME